MAPRLIWYWTVMDRKVLRNNKADVDCSTCSRMVKVSAATLLGHGTEKCPRCGLRFEGDKRAGRNLDNQTKKMRRKFE